MPAEVTAKRTAKGSTAITITIHGSTIRSTLSAKKTAAGGAYHILVGRLTEQGAAYFRNGNALKTSTIGNWTRGAAPSVSAETYLQGCGWTADDFARWTDIQWAAVEVTA